MIDSTLLKNEERAVYSLRALYKQYGYLPYKMSKFEEYDLYVQNKDFLVSDRVITFNDTNGKLMALKPDVTLSIIKNAEDAPGVKTKVYYNENVYRVSESTHQYKEIMQAGLECIGDIDEYDIYEAVFLALKSLETISDRYVLDISHLDITEAILHDISDDGAFCAQILECLKKKSSHDIVRICQCYGISEQDTQTLCKISGIYGKMGDAIEELSSICKGEAACEALDELRTLYSMIKGTGYEEHIRVDFSIINDMNYYNGIVFAGFIDGISSGVLSGGCYDKLVRKMGKRAGAVGFAIYLDLLEGMEEDGSKYDVDVLIIYGRDATLSEIAGTVADMTRLGKSVSVQRSVPEKLRYRNKINIGSDGGQNK